MIEVVYGTYKKSYYIIGAWCMMYGAWSMVHKKFN